MDNRGLPSGVPTATVRFERSAANVGTAVCESRMSIFHKKGFI